MSIVLARVDNRLIHGQVLEAWVPHVQADCLIVVDDVVAQDPFRKQLMVAVVPGELDVEVCSHAEVDQLCSAHLLDSRNVIVLFSTPQDALQAYREGIHFTRLNLGNMHAQEGKRCLSRTLFVGPEDQDDLNALCQLGVMISAQCIPTDRAMRWDCHDEELKG
ncbi:PTS sugar transporter subunit IIB [Desulfuromonas acetoxidans]|uniref:PTS system sorbose subfamily IIB component n=1 Tax=Desulfuromonas acetoxidans (strain DSM 684 / 11070) TaxID=281689 RepID=Q1K315_DESA6|nr:PTS sugar transporter subunit IIB [Desulfuromonas acetoxidans]EAT16716.1 PTS system sorbose subfamily IIB component [Desulfuromonas acetoxidans DSM 684]MBF0644812.1 PTS sugar transporter subunit IIB [Desulfuromonas acetoxidans]NVD23655.1 PTS sugar transporter subunit IIB [Desulfuromonas acetoxidans]NVE15960.1 PTS sugar transporter subunit IIB [Desulfuromonas acetoxidans]